MMMAECVSDVWAGQARPSDQPRGYTSQTWPWLDTAPWAAWLCWVGAGGPLWPAHHTYQPVLHQHSHTDHRMTHWPPWHAPVSSLASLSPRSPSLASPQPRAMLAVRPRLSWGPCHAWVTPSPDSSQCLTPTGIPDPGQCRPERAPASVRDHIRAHSLSLHPRNLVKSDN